jgi:hypothetical protein
MCPLQISKLKLLQIFYNSILTIENSDGIFQVPLQLIGMVNGN